MCDLDIYKERRLTLEEKISALLDTLSVPFKLKGYQYLEMAIKIAIEKPSTTYSVNKEIFHPIAKHYDTNTACVESAIRNAISQAWMKGDYKIQHRIFGQTVRFRSGRPTDAEFIAIIAKTISLDREF